MERKIGEVFEYQGKKLKAVQTTSNKCYNCHFYDDGFCKVVRQHSCGECDERKRIDEKPVIFVEVKEEPEEQPQKLNLCEVLKHCPVGEPFWSPMFGDVKYYGIDQINKEVGVTVASGITWDINADGTLTIDDIKSDDVMLYPSREQRDWTKVKYEPKKELPRTWEEFCKNYPREKGESCIDLYSEICTCSYAGYSREIDRDRNVLPSEQAAEAHLALIQLHQLRDAWREGWVPDWKDDEQDKYSIIKSKGEYEIIQAYISRFLAFQDEKRADEFKDCFIDLIRKAGDLI